MTCGGSVDYQCESVRSWLNPHVAANVITERSRHATELVSQRYRAETLVGV